MKIYMGRPVRMGREVLWCHQDSRRVHHVLSPNRSQLIWNHSPDGFNWGYGGSGPAQLALALLLDVFDDAELAQLHYQSFKATVIASLPTDGEWEIFEEQIRDFVARRQGQEARP